MKNFDSKVIGYFSLGEQGNVVCIGEACVIAGSEESMRQHVEELFPNGNESNKIKKTRFGDIVKGMQHGGSYAFDKESYKPFYPLAKETGINVMEADFEKAEREGNPFLIIQLEFP